MSPLLLLSMCLGSVSFLSHDIAVPRPLASPQQTDIGFSIESFEDAAISTWFINAHIGGGITFFEWSGNRFRLQVGSDAAAWLTLGHTGKMTFPLSDSDFMFSFPISFVWKEGNYTISSLIRWSHISGHLGDGASKLLKRDIDPITYSRDFVTLFLGHEVRERLLWEFNLKIYLTVTRLIKTVPKDVNRWPLTAGIELLPFVSSARFCEEWSPYFVAEVGEAYLSSQVGMQVRGPHQTKIRLAFTLFVGSDQRGQFIGEKISKAGLGLFFN